MLPQVVYDSDPVIFLLFLFSHSFNSVPPSFFFLFYSYVVPSFPRINHALRLYFFAEEARVCALTCYRFLFFFNHRRIKAIAFGSTLSIISLFSVKWSFDFFLFFFYFTPASATRSLILFVCWPLPNGPSFRLKGRRRKKTAT